METASEVAEIVAVRLMPEVPAEKVAVICPAASVVPDAALSCPVEALKLTGCPDKTTLVADNAVAVRVVVDEPSLLTLVLLEESAIRAAVDAVVVVDTALPPQLARKIVDKNSNKVVSEIVNLKLERTEFPR